MKCSLQDKKHNYLIAAEPFQAYFCTHKNEDILEIIKSAFVHWNLFFFFFPIEFLMFFRSLRAAIHLLILLTPQESCHLSEKKQRLPLVWAGLSTKPLPLCGRAGWLPLGRSGCWRWHNTGCDSALHFSSTAWIIEKSWMLLGILETLIEQRTYIVMADTRWNTNVLTCVSFSFGFLKGQTSGSRKKVFKINSDSFLETCIVFLSIIFITHLGSFRYVCSSRDLLCLYFPYW